MELRLNRFFTENGIISRREADRAIEEGRVRVNGRVARLGDRVTHSDQIMLDGRLIRVSAKAPVILAYHKPVGVECTADPRAPDNIIAAVRYPGRIFPIGRLDKDSEGLILLTNLGDIVNKVLRAEFHHEKEYLVTTAAPIADEALDKLRAGVRLGDGWTRPCKVTRINGHKIRMVLTEGKNRQIRRMIAKVGGEVARLKRTRIMSVELGELPCGHWRKFSKVEAESFVAGLNLH